ncbi:phytoene desaturase family protein [Metabacillus indicus]|uniref:phytoene desaturase family protein n=1 Tax=Metabacillus indicus TaxID=246786 RepID=UPI002A06DD65|nr:phytoene desaturase family protein [Metabacillus indicus]MDX8291400.1 phytoene desaturase family protein [Metabacillus indicus]
MNKKAVIIGGGLGGLSAAIRLRSDGYHVTVVEKGERVGGKLNMRGGLGYTFDTGPSILTMPWVLEKLFKSAGRNLSDYLTIKRIEPGWRTFYEDGTTIDLTSDLPVMLEELKKVSEEDANEFFDYLQYCSKMYEYSMKSFYSKSLSGLNDLRSLHSVKELLMMEPLKSMDGVTRKHFKNKKIRQLFNFLIMYIGSSPYHAPAVLSQLTHVQLGLGVYYVEGGMYNIALAMNKLLHELGADILLNTKAERIVTEGSRAAGVELADGRILHADIVVSNLEAIPAYNTLLKDKAGSSQKASDLQKYEPTVSGLVMLLGVDRTYENLAHHNFFFSEDPEKEFHQIFNEGKLADDPTVYVGISAKSDPTQAPAGKENLFVLTHVPPLKEGENWEFRKETYRAQILDKLERMGMTGLREHIEFEYTFTPNDLQSLYGANGGSIYGVATDRKKNGGFKIPSKSTLLENLYFVGGSTHPGGGVPMVTLSGQLTADLIAEHEDKKPQINQDKEIS